jgi:rhodanese-related sulfurtransferase
MNTQIPTRLSTLLLLLCATTLAVPALAETVKGRIKYVSNKASTIQVEVKGKEPVVVRFGPNTQYKNVAGIQELSPPDLIKVEHEPGQPATQIAKIVFGLPPGVEIDIQELLAILQQQRGPYLLGDARPTKKFPASHIPSAVSTPAADPQQLLARLPADKNQLLVFYCGGPTCPFTAKATEIATAAGYTNVKGFQAGLPGWNKARLPLHSNRAWLAKNLDPHHVVIDVRDKSQAGNAHLPGAVSVTHAELAAMTQRFIDTRTIAALPGVSDMRAPIILYADTQADREVLLAYKELRSWGYNNVAILEGGLNAWQSDDLPTATGQLASRIDYSKKLAKGAILVADFNDLLAKPGTAIYLDVRSDAEVIKLGTLKDSLHIPLDQLAGRLGELPADREIIVFCENGIRAEMAYQTLRSNGMQARFLNETTHFDDQGNIKL